LLVNKNGPFSADVHRAGRRMTDERLPVRLGFRALDHLHVVKLVSLDPHSSLMHWASCGKVRIAHSRDGDGAVDVGDVDDVDIHIRGLHVNAPAFGKVGDVDLIDVAGTRVVPGMVRFARTEREPGRHADAAHVHSAGKDHQRGRPDRMSGRSAGNPSPTSVEGDPAAIVEGRVSPGLILDPHPTPGRVINPVAVVIGRPIGGNVVGEPDGAVVSARLPGTRSIQFTGARNFGAYIAVGGGVGDLLVAHMAPMVQFVPLAHLEPLRHDGVGAEQFNGLLKADVLRESTRAGDQGIVGEVGIDGRTLVRHHVHANIRGLVQTEAAVGRVHVHLLTGP